MSMTYTMSFWMKPIVSRIQAELSMVTVPNSWDALRSMTKDFSLRELTTKSSSLMTTLRLYVPQMVQFISTGLWAQVYGLFLQSQLKSGTLHMDGIKRMPNILIRVTNTKETKLKSISYLSTSIWMPILRTAQIHGQNQLLLISKWWHQQFLP
jgi:hypothetical protein